MENVKKVKTLYNSVEEAKKRYLYNSFHSRLRRHRRHTKANKNYAKYEELSNGVVIKINFNIEENFKNEMELI